MSFSTWSAGALPGPDFCFIFAPCGYDEPEILPSENPAIGLKGADGEHNRQRIYQIDGGIEELQKICGDPKQLKHNYRNGFKICRVADAIRDEADDDEGLEATSNYDEKTFPSSVSLFSAMAVDDQIAACLEAIRTQLLAYPTGLIGVLAPLRATVRRVAEQFDQSPIADHYQMQLFETGYQPISTQRRILVSTIHGAKGLEFRTLHLVGMDMISKFSQRQRKVAYTAVTRAKTSLSIYHDSSLPGYLEQAISAADTDEIDPPGLDELFKVK